MKLSLFFVITKRIRAAVFLHMNSFLVTRNAMAATLMDREPAELTNIESRGSKSKLNNQKCHARPQICAGVYDFQFSLSEVLLFERKLKLLLYESLWMHIIPPSISQGPSNTTRVTKKSEHQFFHFSFFFLSSPNQIRAAIFLHMRSILVTGRPWQQL